MCGFFAWGGRGAVVAQFLLDPPTHKKSETGNRRTLTLAVNADADADTLRLTLTLTLTPGGERWSLAVNA
jgi:hypothetical protein